MGTFKGSDHVLICGVAPAPSTPSDRLPRAGALECLLPQPRRLELQLVATIRPDGVDRSNMPD
jgi:hypothetical protein